MICLGRAVVGSLCKSLQNSMLRLRGIVEAVWTEKITTTYEHREIEVLVPRPTLLALAGLAPKMVLTSTTATPQPSLFRPS